MAMMLERHDTMHATELFDMSKEDRRLHMSKMRGESVNDWLMGELGTEVIIRLMRLARVYRPE